MKEITPQESIIFKALKNSSSVRTMSMLIVPSAFPSMTNLSPLRVIDWSTSATLPVSVYTVTTVCFLMAILLKSLSLDHALAA